MTPQRSLRRPPRGLRVVGRDFYLWEADAREAVRLAQDLSRRSVPLVVRRRREPLR
jgi:hypothetical protein